MYQKIMNDIPPVTRNLLIVNVLVFMGAFLAKRWGIEADDYLGLHFFLSEDFNLAQLFTYMFMHANLTHLFCNMFALYMFGRTLEMVWGSSRFLTFYLVCGIGAGLIQELVVGVRYFTLASSLPPEAVQVVLTEGAEILRSHMNYTNPELGALNATLNGLTVGASGSIYGILLGFGMMFPKEPIYVMFLPVPIKAKYFVIGYAVIELLAGLANNASDNVAHFAHLGGMVFGLLLILYWRKKNRRNGYYQYYN